MSKEKGYNSSHVYCQAKGWSKKCHEFFLNDFGKGFLNGMTEGEKMRSHQKGFLKLKCLSPLKMLTSSLFEDTFGVFFFSISFSSAPSLEELGVLMIFEEKITSSITSFQLASIYWQCTHIPEWSYTC
jgi:hypothetical protein